MGAGGRSGDTIYQDTGAVADLVGDMTTLQARLTGILEDVKAQVAPLNETWIGDDQVAHADVQARWNTATEGLHGVLRDLSVAAGTGNEGMIETNQRSMRRFQGIG